MWLDNASEIDMLFYSPYASTIANTIIKRENTPLTVGLFGKWGAGKSTLINLIKQELETDKEHCIAISINAWLFEGYTDAKTSLMEIITTELQKEASIKEQIAEKCKSLWRRINKIKLGKSLLSLGGNLLATYLAPNTLSTEGAISAMQGVASAFSGDELKEETTISISEFRTEFAELINSLNGKTVVFIIDDLDRCSPERIIDTLEAIKLFLAVQGTTFLIAADDIVIESAIKHKYPELMQVDNRYSREYIEKIIQLPITIPQLSEKDVMNYLMLLVAQQYLKEEHFNQLLTKIREKNIHIRDTCISCGEMIRLIDELSGQKFRSLSIKQSTVVDDLKTIDGIRQIIAHSLNGNPRQAKRFLNAFMMKRELAELYYPEEINVAVLAKIMALHQISHKAFEQLYQWNCEFDGKIPHLQEALDLTSADITGYSEWRTDVVQKWKYCPPTDIENYPLDRYFYLTRENLQSGERQSTLTTAAKNILAEMQKASAGTIDRIFDEIDALGESQTSALLGTFIQGMGGKSSDWIVARKMIDAYPERLPELANKISTIVIQAPAIPFFTRLLEKSESTFMEIYDKKPDKERNLMDRAKAKGKK